MWNLTLRNFLGRSTNFIQDVRSLNQLNEEPRASAVWPSEDQAGHSFTRLMQESLAEGNFASLSPESLPINERITDQRLKIATAGIF